MNISSLHIIIMSFQSLAHIIRVNHTNHLTKIHTINQTHKRIIELFFKQYVKDRIEDVLMSNSANGIMWGYLHKYKKYHFAYIAGPFTEPIIKISPIWVKESVQLKEIIYSETYRHKKIELEQLLSDRMTAIRIHNSVKSDPLNQLCCIWAEFIHTSPLALHTFSSYKINEINNNMVA